MDVKELSKICNTYVETIKCPYCNGKIKVVTRVGKSDLEVGQIP
jgi:DNA-directed RNA polymerase subunit RPC12/RpoP